MNPIELQSIGFIFLVGQEVMPKPDISLLQDFKSQVSDLGPEACLPMELNDSWLLAVLQSADEILGEGDGSAEGALALAALLNLLAGKRHAISHTGLDEVMVQRLLCDYRIELALELVHRRTEVKYEAATMQTIFTNREVKTWKDHFPHLAS
jgi:hypothetical protein